MPLSAWTFNYCAAVPSQLPVLPPSHSLFLSVCNHLISHVLADLYLVNKANPRSNWITEENINTVTESKENI